MTLKHRIGLVVLPLLPINRRTFDILRFEFGCVFRRFLNTINPVYHLRVNRIRQQNDLMVNIGSGGRGLADWVNVDAVRHVDTMFVLDVRRKLPFRENQVRAIFAEHVIEHIDFRDDIPNVLAEFHRILKPGGIVRIIVPDARRFLEAYVVEKPDQWAEIGWDIRQLPEDIYTPMHVVNHIFHQSGEHLFAYDFETLKFALERAGFGEIIQQQFGVSIDPSLSIDQPGHRPYSLYVEARK